jgi:hypothetical protein
MFKFELLLIERAVAVPIIPPPITIMSKLSLLKYCFLIG